MAKAHHGSFVPKNPQKYAASNIANITYRSSWEQTMMILLDQHPSVTAWASEAIRIPYDRPERKNGVVISRRTFYVPDFFVQYEDRNAVKHTEIIEIKPRDETDNYQGKVSPLKEARQALNGLKWKAAMKFCQARGWHFRVTTETELFAFKRKTGV